MKKWYSIALIGAVLSGLGLVQPGVSSAATTCNNQTFGAVEIAGSLTVTGDCTLNGTTVTGSVTLVNGTLTMNGATIRGSVSQTGGSLRSYGSTIRGSVTVTNTAAGSFNEICGGAIGGSVTVSDSSGTMAPEFFRLLGQGTTGLGNAMCGPLTIGGSVTFRNNQIFTRLSNAVVSGSVSVTGNTATDFQNENPQPGSSVISGNTIRGSLSCSGNMPDPTPLGGANNVTGSKTGECTAALGF